MLRAGKRNETFQYCEPGNRSLKTATAPENAAPPGDTPRKDTPPKETPGKRKPMKIPPAGCAGSLQKPSPSRATRIRSLEEQAKFVVAGQINLPAVYYGGRAGCCLAGRESELLLDPPENFGYRETGEAGEVGKGTGREILSNNGFIFRDGDYLECNLRRSRRAFLLRFSTRPQKSAGKALTLVYTLPEGSSYYIKKKESRPTGLLSSTDTI